MKAHQDAGTHRWVPDEVRDQLVTMDDATGEHTSMHNASGYRNQGSNALASRCSTATSGKGRRTLA